MKEERVFFGLLSRLVLPRSILRDEKKKKRKKRVGKYVHGADSKYSHGISNGDMEWL